MCGSDSFLRQSFLNAFNYLLYYPTNASNCVYLHIYFHFFSTVAPRITAEGQALPSVNAYLPSRIFKSFCGFCPVRLLLILSEFCLHVVHIIRIQNHLTDVQSSTWECAAIPGSSGSGRRSTRLTGTAFCRHQSPVGAFCQTLHCW